MKRMLWPIAVLADLRLRWWKLKPRFQVEYTGKIRRPGGEIACQLKNISEGGAFVACAAKLDPGEELELRFNAGGTESISSRARVVFRRPADRELKDRGYGIQFIETDAVNRRAIVKLVRELDEAGIPVENRGPGSSWMDFRYWFRRLISTSKRLIPEWDRPEPRLLPEWDLTGTLTPIKTEEPGPGPSLNLISDGADAESEPSTTIRKRPRKRKAG